MRHRPPPPSERSSPPCPKGVVPGASRDPVAPVERQDQIVAGSADQAIGEVGPEQVIVAGAADDRHRPDLGMVDALVVAQAIGAAGAPGQAPLVYLRHSWSHR